jgi:uncharacterized protein
VREPTDPKAQHEDEKLDETIDETFPASDAPANTVEVGIRTGQPSSAAPPVVSDNPALSRFELTVDGQTAFLVYERTPNRFTIVHTEVPEALRGRHFGEMLVEHALEVARREELHPSIICPFARAYVRRHPPSSTTR